METFVPRLLQYNSVRLIRVKNWKLAAIYWCLLFAVTLYVVIYTIILAKGYQVNDEATGTVSTKVKGTASTGDFYDWNNAIPYDAMDLIFPPIESNALFIPTSFVATQSQTRGLCDGNEDIDECTTDDDCEENEYNWKSQGIITGKCASNGRCQVYGWCPLEDDSIRTTFNNVGAWTVFVKNDIRFPNFDIETTNAMDYEGTGRLTFGKNLFSIDDMLADATNGKVNVSQIATKGAILLVDIDWTCNFDNDIKDCIPDFKFERIDNDGDGIVSEGFNFRTVVYENNSTIRELKKLYGIRITFTSSGRGGRFSFAALTLTLGAGIAYLGVSKLIADLILSNFMKESHKYSEAKYFKIDNTKLLDVQRASMTSKAFGVQKSNEIVNELAKYVETNDKTSTVKNENENENRNKDEVV
eukprot:65863_1